MQSFCQKVPSNSLKSVFPMSDICKSDKNTRPVSTCYKCLTFTMRASNVAKTHSMLICSKSKHRSIKNSDETFGLKMCDKSLDIVEKTKYLGVQIDQNLDWKEHRKYVASKVSRSTGFL